ncbi:insulin-like growth factor binding protein [Anaeramoeba flamelloides]|uniref:Insulin-like growth factor binding protein n=1 Tax=Anaeramoeba flamelloides TaxID=1746091 RepID=A0ABQ8XE78_9EUKA|nr:insulin-like growth factor binding protein [Anaeramoeba flamelloides]
MTKFSFYLLVFFVVLLKSIQVNGRSEYHKTELIEYSGILEPNFPEKEQTFGHTPNNEHFNPRTIPNFFVQNNQIVSDPRIKFLGKTFGQGTWFFSNQSIIYSMGKHTIHMRILNANLSDLHALKETQSKTHYYRGGFKAKWKTDLSNYEGVKYSSIFEGVDLVFETTRTANKDIRYQDKIKSSFHLSQAKAISKIKWQFQTSEDLEMRLSPGIGNLQFVSKLTNEIILEESGLLFFQNNIQLNGKFNLDKSTKTVTFQINDHKLQQEEHLIIDPTYSTFFAGDYTDEIQDFKIDSEGNFIGVGTTMSRNFPADGDLVYIEGYEGAYRDVLVFKLSPDCDLIWSGYLSSIIDDRAMTVIIDSKDDIYLGGYTDYYDSNETTNIFPTTEGAYRMGCVKNNQGTPFITKLSRDGDLVNSTVMCGEGFDQITNLALSPDESILYFLGGGNSDKFPTDDQNGETINCLVSTNNNFYGIMDSQLSNLSYCKCFEAGEEDDPDQTSVTRIHFLDNYLYFGGNIQGQEEKLKQHENCTYQRSANPAANKYFLYGRFNKDDLSIDYVCFYGGTNGDETFKDMKFDSEGNIWIVGSATSSDLETSEGALFPLKSPVSTENGAIMKFKEKDCLYASYYYNNENDNNCLIASIDLDDQDQILIYAQDYRPLETQYDYIYGDNSAIQIFNNDFNETFLTISVPTLVSPKTSFNNKNIYTLFFSGFSNSGFLTYTTQNAWQDMQQGDYDGQIISFKWDCGEGNATTHEGCVPCSNGTYNDEIYIKNECKKCLPGTYQDEEGAIECKPCGYGTFQKRMGWTVCDECEEGTFGNETKLTECFDCNPGTYSDEVKLSECSICEAGYYQNISGQTTCRECALGYYGNVTGEDECNKCEAGTYANSEQSTGCKACEIGTYQELTGETKCEYCSPGTFSDKRGSTSCKTCKPGTYQPNVRSNECRQCEKGFYQDEEGATKCNSCEGGTVATEKNSTSCTVCGEGTHSNDRFTICENCPQGTYSNKKKISSRDECTPCPMGTYGNRAGLKSADECIPCKDGYWSDTEGGISDAVCIPCSKGTFLDQASTEKGCQTCELGSYTDEEAMMECKLCPEGSESAHNFQSCVKCGSGTYAEVEGSPECTKCESGTFNNGTGETSCKKCVHPEYCLGGDKCSSGRNPDTLCEICFNGYFELNQSCQKCPSNLQYIILVIVILLVSILLFVFKKRVQRMILEDPFPMFRIIITFLQLTTSLFTLKLSWPLTIKSTISKWGSIFVLDLGTIANPDCFSEMDWYNKWLFQFFIPIIILAILLLFYFGFKLYLYKKDSSVQKVELEIFFSRLLSLSLKYFFIPMSNISFQPFNYSKDPITNKTVLSVDPSISTSDSTYKKYLPVFVLSIIIYIVGIPLFFIIILIKAKRADFNKFWSNRVGWIFLNYKSNRYWFEMFEIFIKFLLALSAILFANDDDGIRQRNYFLLVLFIIALALMIYLKPYQVDVTLNEGKFAAEDKAQIGLYIMIIGAITLALSYLNTAIFLILWPVGAIIGFVGLYYSYLKMQQQKVQVNLKYNTKNEIKKQEKMLRRLTKKETFSDLHLLKLNQQIQQSLLESKQLEKDLKIQVKQLDRKIGFLKEKENQLLRKRDQFTEEKNSIQNKIDKLENEKK